ncbi:MAG: RidA family protein [Anaerolineae bacterium]|nr:RidA family protein [Anaerolineae bacterium]
MQKTHHNPHVVSNPGGLYSQLVKVDVGDATFLYLAGQVSEDKDGNVVGADDMAAQAEQIYKNIAAILATEDARLSDIVRATTYITDMTERGAVSAIRKKLFPVNPPATSLVEVSALAGDEWLIEVEVTAVIPRKTN